MITKRCLFMGTAAALLLVHPSLALAATPTVSVTKDPECGCCSGWVDHLRKDGFVVDVVISTKLNQLKARLGVPSALVSCHTAEVDGYVIEGHVPADSIHRLLAERPALRGLSVPGMPVGSPGMEVEGQAPETYSVIAFGSSGQRIFARYEGTKRLTAP